MKSVQSWVSLKVVFVIVLLVGAWNPAKAIDIPFARAIETLEPQLMDKLLLDTADHLARYVCNQLPKNIRPDLVPLYRDTCFIPSLIELIYQQNEVLAKGESSIDLQELSSSDLPKRFQFLKSMSWSKKRFSVQDPTQAVSQILLSNLALYKSFLSYIKLVQIWNGSSQNSSLQLYMFPKISAYLNSSTLLGASLEYHNSVVCNQTAQITALSAKGCQNYKNQVLNLIVAPIANTKTQLNDFFTTLNSQDLTIVDKQIGKVKGIIELNLMLNQIKNDPNIFAQDLFDGSEIKEDSNSYLLVSQIIRSTQVVKVNLANEELVKVYLNLNSMMELKLAIDSIDMSGALPSANRNDGIDQNLIQKMQSQIEQIISETVFYMEGQDENF
jgi:hypothetical protein